MKWALSRIDITEKTVCFRASFLALNVDVDLITFHEIVYHVIWILNSAQRNHGSTIQLFHPCYDSSIWLRLSYREKVCTFPFPTYTYRSERLLQFTFPPLSFRYYLDATDYRIHSEHLVLVSSLFYSIDRNDFCFRICYEIYPGFVYPVCY